jgi:hypothetical protein
MQEVMAKPHTPEFVLFALKMAALKRGATLHSCELIRRCRDGPQWWQLVLLYGISNLTAMRGRELLLRLLNWNN